MTTNLYELSTELAIINNEVYDAEGVLTPELEKMLDELTMAVNSKVGSIAKWITNIDADGESLDKEIARLKARKDRYNHLQDRLKDYIKTSMLRAGLPKIDTGINTLSICKNPPSVEVVHEELIPAKYKIVKQVISIDKAQIKTAMLAGEQVEGCNLVQDKVNLRIK